MKARAHKSPLFYHRLPCPPAARTVHARCACGVQGMQGLPRSSQLHGQAEVKIGEEGVDPSSVQGRTVVLQKG
jgi:hypothetical protein